MAKAKQPKKKARTQKSKPRRKPAKLASVKLARKKQRSSKKKRRSALRKFQVASITSGGETSTLNPRGRLVVEREEEATPRVHRGDLSGDLQGISRRELYDSESVSELAESGQDLEAELIEGVEEAPDADQGEVRVHEAPEPHTPEYKARRKI